MHATPAAAGGLRLTLADGSGEPAGLVESLELCPVAAARPADPAAVARGSLFALDWEPLSEPTAVPPTGPVPVPWDAFAPDALAAEPAEHAVVACPAGERGTDPATAARGAVRRTRELLAGGSPRTGSPGPGWCW